MEEIACRRPFEKLVSDREPLRQDPHPGGIRPSSPSLAPLIFDGVTTDNGVGTSGPDAHLREINDAPVLGRRRSRCRSGAPHAHEAGLRLNAGWQDAG